MLLLIVVVEYTRVVTLCACIIVWSGCDYFQCDREIRFMCDGGKGGAKVHGGRWMYVGSRVYCILVFRMYVHECVVGCYVCCILVCLCACICPHMYVCVSICVC